MFVFLDLETTGLEPMKDYIVQFAMVAVDNNLEEIGAPVYYDVALTAEGAGRLYTNPFVRKMHHESGLLRRLEHKIENPGTPGIPQLYELHRICSIEEVQQKAFSYLCTITQELDLSEMSTTEPFFYLAGNSVHFDLAFMKVHMPKIASCFSHKILDITSIGMFEEKFGNGKINVYNSHEHDALSDVRNSLELLRAYAQRCDLTQLLSKQIRR